MIITVIVSPTGQSQIETSGFQGAECQHASRFVEQALGTKASERLTAEFFETQETGTIIQEGQS